MKLNHKSCLVLSTLMISLMISATLRAAENELTILNWSEYLSETLIKAFEQAHNVKIKQVYFESDDARDEILLQTGGKGFDLIVLNGASFRSYSKKGWLQPIPEGRLANLKYIDKRWLNSFESATNYGIPYFWGTLGIAYRKDLVSQPIESWKQFFQPADELKGKIVLVKSSADIIGMALKSLGYSANSEDRKELAQAKALLMAQKPHVAKYGYITLQKDSALVSGKIVASMVYGGDALNVAQHNDQIAYVLPKEGGNIWIDFFCLSSGSTHVDMALKFLDFINEPKWAALNAKELYLATTNNEAITLLSDDILSDKVIYPDKELLNKSEFYKTLSPRSQRTRAAIFSKVIE
jgi:spermidine/putrescine transport system substrate-binding protein